MKLERYFGIKICRQNGWHKVKHRAERNILHGFLMDGYAFVRLINADLD